MLKDEEQFRVIAHEIPVGILIIDNNGEILYINPAACRILDMNEPIQ